MRMQHRKPVTAATEGHASNGGYTRMIRVLVGLGLCFVGLCYLAVRPKAVRIDPVAETVIDASTAEALLNQGEQLQRQGDLAQAIEVFRRVPNSKDPWAFKARAAEASTLLYLGRLDEAESAVGDLVKIAPDRPQTTQLQVAVLSSSGRRWEAVEPMRRLIKERLGGYYQALIDLAIIHQMPSPADEFLMRLKESQDANSQLCLGRYANSVGLGKEGLQLFSQAMKQRESLIEAYVQFSLALLDLDETERFIEWQDAMPEDCERHPQTWLARAQFFDLEQDFDNATRCYANCLNLDPNHEVALYRISILLKNAGHDKPAAAAAARAELAGQYHELAVTLFDDGGSAKTIADIAELAVRLGRTAEAAAWADALGQAGGSREQVGKIAQLLENANPTPVSDWGSCQEPLASFLADRSSSWPSIANRLQIGESTDSRSAKDRLTPFKLKDVAAQSRLNFSYFSRDVPQGDGRRMYEYTGGSAAVIDLNLDRRPDLFLSQATRRAGTSTPNAASDLTDSLFLNRHGNHFEDVAGQAYAAGREYGQGAAVGDVNGDGFPDLVVSSLSGCRLLVANGDGTFADQTEAAGLTHAGWTTSCAIADVDRDGDSDIYCATYLGGDDIFERVCENDAGHKFACNPLAFPAVVDVYYEGRGDGTFEETASQSGFDAPDGDGLGLVVADFMNAGQTDVFVANDERPSFLFRPSSESTDHARWLDDGLYVGVAYSGTGDDKANMGIAVEDVDHDGYQDIFVTNFYHEVNTLFLSQGGHSFLDATKRKGLHDPSFEMLGFGAQFVDFDLDGWHDLIVANGHVDDYSFQGTPYRMPTQVFRNQGAASFKLVEPGTDEGAGLSDYFGRPLVGRSVAVLDWNSDRRDDLLVTHLGTPAALISNLTESPHESVAVRLVGTESNRDAIGSIVRVKRGDFQWVRQCKAGDGYLASNERLLRFGLGQSSGPVTVEITWPSGATETHHKVLPADYVAIEKSSKLTSRQEDR